MSGKTIAEKIIGAHAGREVKAGEIAFCTVDRIMMHDANGPLAVKAFRNMGGVKVYDPEKISIIFDHCAPPATEKHANIHAFLREFAKEQGINFTDSGHGVCHQLMVESGVIKPGDIVIGTDSHTCTYGAIGALATGLGATDVAAAMFSGKLWFKVPGTIRVNLKGNLQPGCSAKDIILYTIGMLGADGATYKSVEFYGDYLEKCTVASHLTIANMVVEMGAKCGFTCWSGLGIAADNDAEYERELDIDLDKLEPTLARPHTVDNMCTVSDVLGQTITMAVLGSCTNGRIEDLKTAADMLQGRHIHKDVRMLVLPASEKILKQAAEEGILSTLITAGATICTPGCGVCVGTLGGVPSDGDVVISSTNRNFKGRMGNNKAFIYLASPETVVASAISGKISDPRKEILCH